MIIMSVDYGDVRTGIAFSDASETLASPFCVIKESYKPKLVDKIINIAVEHHTDKIVVGLPVNMDGSYGYRCSECRELGTMLNDKSGIEVEYQDERLTTVIAHNVLSNNNVRGKKRKENIDAVSAVIILQSYLDKNK